jgi:hypothetical protein
LESQLTDGFVKRFILTTKCQSELVEIASSLFCNFIFNRFKRQQPQKERKQKTKKKQFYSTRKWAMRFFDIPPQTNPHRSFLHFPPSHFFDSWLVLLYSVQFSHTFPDFSISLICFLVDGKKSLDHLRGWGHCCSFFP